MTTREWLYNVLECSSRGGKQILIGYIHIATVTGAFYQYKRHIRCLVNVTRRGGLSDPSLPYTSYPYWWSLFPRIAL